MIKPVGGTTVSYLFVIITLNYERSNTMSKKEPITATVLAKDIVNIILTIIYTLICIGVLLGLSCLITPIPAAVVCGIAILMINKKYNLFI